jgi:outer membrane protein assembly factor BamD (BamD/ComL family)
MAGDTRTRCSRTAAIAARLILALMPLGLAGCQSFSSPLSAWRAAYDGNLFRGVSREEMADVAQGSSSQNLMDRWLTPKATPGAADPNDPASTLILGSDGWRPIKKPAKDPQAEAEFQAALTLFQQGKLPQAEKEFTKIAKNRKGTTYGETGQYYLAEAQFQRKKFIDAHDSFERLHADYPGTEFRDELVSREYEIAQHWMNQTNPKAPKDQLIPWYGRFDGRLPVIDTAGSGLKALEHVRHNDPNGPLADKAAMEIASYYMNHRDFESAAMYYDQFITEYPKSPHLQEVQFAAIDARMRGYLGPQYDDSGLEKARDLTRKTMDSFNVQQAKVEGLYQTLALINDAQAEKIYTTGMYYKKAGKVTSAEYYLGKIPRRWPNTEWAVKAKHELALLAKMPRKPSKPSKIMIPPGAASPGGGMMGGMGGMMGMPGMGMGMPMGGMGMM